MPNLQKILPKDILCNGTLKVNRIDYLWYYKL